MIPSTWAGVVMALGVYRIVRLIGWDDLPPIAAARARLTGERVVLRGSLNAHAGVTNEMPTAVWEYDRPLLAHFISCGYCIGFWISALVYIAWRFSPSWTMTVLATFALSGIVGLIAKNLDA